MSKYGWRLTMKEEEEEDEEWKAERKSLMMKTENC